jgi:hypothetical protein
MRRMALSMAILTQVRVAIERYRLALNDLDFARESTQVDQRMAAYARAGLSTRAESELEVIRAETRALNSEYQRYGAYAAAQAAFGRIYNSVGLEVVPESIEENSLAEIGAKVAANITQIENETFVKFVTEAPKLPKLDVRFLGLVGSELDDPRDAAGLKLAKKLSRENSAIALPAVDASLQQKLLESMKRALQRNRVELANDDASYVLNLKLLMDVPNNGVRRAQWLVSLVAKDGTQLGESRYTSSLAADPSPGSLNAFAEAAIISNLRNISTWLKPAVVN